MGIRHDCYMMIREGKISYMLCLFQGTVIYTVNPELNRYPAGGYLIHAGISSMLVRITESSDHTVAGLPEPVHHLIHNR